MRGIVYNLGVQPAMQQTGSNAPVLSTQDFWGWHFCADDSAAASDETRNRAT